MSGLPRYTLFTDQTLRERDEDPKKFAEDVARIERSNSAWDTDRGYANLIQECRVAADGDENRAEQILIQRLAGMLATRYIKELKEKEAEAEAEAEEERRRADQTRKNNNILRKRKAEREENEKKKLIVNGKINFPAIGLHPAPRHCGEWIKQRYDGVSDVKLVIMKGLFVTDVSTNHNRLSIPHNQVIDRDFLTAEEIQFLNTSVKGKSKEGIPVDLYGPVEGEVTDMALKKWELRSTDSYVLNKGWSSLLNKFPNVLKKHAIIQLWSFRTPARKLAFRITKIGQLDLVRGEIRPCSDSGSEYSGSRSRSEDAGIDEGYRSGYDGDESSGGSNTGDGDHILEEGEVTPPPRRRQRVWPRSIG